MSLDGFIARPDGGIEWLKSVSRTGEDYGYRRFFGSVDTLIIGRKTYELVLGFDAWPYEGKRVVVVTHEPSPPQHGEHFYNGPPEGLVRRLEHEGLQHAYIDGGGVIQQFIAARLVSRATISVIPVLLGDGIRLFGNAGRDVPLALRRSQSFESGLVQLEYELEPAARAPLDAAGLTFRPLKRDDLPLLLTWFNTPHARRWYGRGDTLAAVEAEYLPSIEGSKPTRRYIAKLGDRPIGLLEWCRFGDYPEIMPFYGVEDGDIVNCDVIIGEPDVVYRGLGAPMIRRFLREIVFTEPRFTTCLIDPEVDNKSSIRAYEKAGFRHVRTMADDGEGNSIYLMELRQDELTVE
ncbi:MAG TPA: GNAT family N-acetyltransferase [Polyangiaceae bacterium]|nr:GNAT family N-acetyltransferase [Polyangiaceae bacterium]